MEEGGVQLPVPATFFVPGQMSLGIATGYSCVNCMVGVPVSKPICISVHCVTLFLCEFSESRLEVEKFLAQLWPRPLLPLEPEPNCHQFGQGVKCTHHAPDI